jgi:hypothetical protein
MDICEKAKNGWGKWTNEEIKKGEIGKGREKEWKRSEEKTN